MHIESELIHIVCDHTECTLTAIRTECAFGHSTFIGGLKVNCIITGFNAGVIYSHVIDCARKQADILISENQALQIFHLV